MEVIPSIIRQLDNILSTPYGQICYYMNNPHHHSYRRAPDSHSSLGPLLLQSSGVSPKDRGDFGAVSRPVGKDGFQVSIDVQQFKPNELTVKTVDNTVVVEGKHEERADRDGLISRHFVRRYVLPEGYDPQLAVSTLSSDGYLTIKVPAPNKTDGHERIVHIQQTGPAHLSVKENAKEDGEEEGDKKK